MLLLDTDLSWITAGQMKDSGIDKAEITGIKEAALLWSDIFKASLAHVKQLGFIVPVPGKGALRKLIQAAQIGHIGKIRGNVGYSFLQGLLIDADGLWAFHWASFLRWPYFTHFWPFFDRIRQ